MFFKFRNNIVGNDSYKTNELLIKRKRTIITKNGVSKCKYENVYNDKVNCNDLILDCIRNIDKPSGEYHEIVNYNKKLGKGVKIVMTENYETNEITSVALDKLNPRQLMFFTLYNAPEYEDLTFGFKTYLDDVACWLISYGLYGENAYKKYGKLIKRKVCKVDGEKRQKVLVNDEEQATLDDADIETFNNYVERNYPTNRKGYFVFNSTNDFVAVKVLARRVVNMPALKEAQAELVNENLGDTEQRIKDYYLKLDNIFKNTNDEKIRLECLKLGGKWLGMENININGEQKHIIQGIQVAVANGDLKDFDFDTDAFEKVEDNI